MSNNNVFDIFKVTLINTIGLSFTALDTELFLKIFVLILTGFYTCIKIYNEFQIRKKKK